MPRTASELVAEAGTDIREIAPQDYATHRVDGVLIDARDPALSHRRSRSTGGAEPAAHGLSRRVFDLRRHYPMGGRRTAGHCALNSPDAYDPSQSKAG